MFPSQARLRRLAIGLAALAAGSSASAESAPTQIVIEHYAFGPPEVTVKAGEKVAFVNNDQIPHSVVVQAPNGETFRSKEQLDEGEVFNVVFSTEGEAAYFCDLHSGLRGKITVTK